MGILEGRVAIVTGASSGIGRACAVRFAEEGAAVVACARRLEKLDELVGEVKSKGGRAVAVACDVAEEADIDGVVGTAVERFGRIDILANIAQADFDMPTNLMDTTRERLLYLYTSGPLQCMLFMQKCFPHMKARKYGRIINTSSFSTIRGTPGFTAYSLAKGAVMALTRNASQEWAQFGIVTNTFVPMILSETFESQISPAATKEIAARSPSRRIGRPYEDCAPVLAFLASEGAGYVNGQVITVDGGMHIIA